MPGWAAGPRLGGSDRFNRVKQSTIERQPGAKLAGARRNMAEEEYAVVADGPEIAIFARDVWQSDGIAWRPRIGWG